MKVSLSAKPAAWFSASPSVLALAVMPPACLPSGSVALEAASAPVRVKLNSAAGAPSPVTVL